MVLRPDEKSSLAEIERDQNIRSKIGTGVKAAATIGTAAAGLGATALGSRIAPFLSKYVPVDLAMKGINKISPKLGQFLKKGQSMGLDIKEGMDYVKSQIEPQKSQSAKENRNIIEQESPELHQFIDQEIRGGRKPIEAGALAYNNQKFKSAIDKLKKAHKLNWGDIIQQIYGNGDQGLPQSNPQSQQQMAAEAMQPPGSLPGSAPSAEAQAASNPQSQQMGPGQQAALNILQKINQKLGQ